MDPSNLTLPRGTDLILQATPPRLSTRTLVRHISQAQSRHKHGEPTQWINTGTRTAV